MTRFYLVCEKLSYLNSGVDIELVDERTAKHIRLESEGGVRSFVLFKNKTRSPIHKDPIYIVKTIDQKTAKDQYEGNTCLR